MSALPPALSLSQPADRTRPAQAAALGQTVIAAASYLVARRAMTEIPAVPLGWARIVGSGILYAVLLAGLRLPILPPRGRRLAYLGAGLLGLPLNQGLFLTGLARTEVSHAALLYTLTPAVLLVLARVFQGERIAPARALGIGLAFLGACAVLSENGVAGGVRLGDVLIGTGMMSWSLYTLVIGRLARADGAVAATAWAFVAGSAATVFLYPLAVPYPGVFWVASPAALGGFVYLLVGSSFTAYLLWTYALSHLSAARVVVFSNLQPVIASALAWGILGERLSINEAVGGVLVLAGVMVVQRA